MSKLIEFIAIDENYEDDVNEIPVFINTDHIMAIEPDFKENSCIFYMSTGKTYKIALSLEDLRKDEHNLLRKK